MDRVYTRPPRTIREVYEGLPEGTPAQLINNQIIMSPSPTNSHQSVLLKIAAELFYYVQNHQLGEVKIAPYDVHLDSRNIFQPDIIFISDENLHKIKESGFYGAPDLVMEILSPSTRRFDKEDKKEVYERCGVKEYWMIEPVEKTAKGFHLVNNGFQPLEAGKATIRFKLFPFSISF